MIIRQPFRWVCITAALLQVAFTLSLHVRDLATSSPSCQPFGLPQVSKTVLSSDGRETSPGNDGTNESTEWPLLASDLISLRPRPGARRLNRRALTDDAWRQAIIKGRRLWNVLERVLADPDSIDTEDCDVASRWDLDEAGLVVEDLFFRWRDILNPNVVPFPQPAKKFYNAKVTTPKGGPAHFFYENAYSPQYGIISAIESSGVHWLDDGRVVRAPDRWSEVTWTIYNSLCHVEDKDPANLRYMLQELVVNGDTNAFQDHIIELRNPRWHSLLRNMNYVLTPDDEDFYALLASSNIVGTVYMLILHANALGRKTIKSIGTYRADPGSAYFLYVELEQWTEHAAGTIDTE